MTPEAKRQRTAGNSSSNDEAVARTLDAKSGKKRAKPESVENTGSDMSSGGEAGASASASASTKAIRETQEKELASAKYCVVLAMQRASYIDKANVLHTILLGETHQEVKALVSDAIEDRDPETLKAKIRALPAALAKL